MGAFGLTTAGEFSNAINDCGLFVNGVNLGTRYEGNYTGGPWPRIGSCEQWTDYTTWSADMKQDIKQFALASMDALQVSSFCSQPLTSLLLTLNSELVLLDMEDRKLFRHWQGGVSPMVLLSWSTGGMDAH